MRIEKIKNFSNTLLKQNADNIFFLSNDWLFYKRYHPVELEKYNLIKFNFLFTIICILFQFLRFQIKNIILLILSIKNLTFSKKLNKKKYDTIFVTYKFNKYYNFKNDSYFSKIYEIYKKNKKNFYVLAINHQKGFFIKNLQNTNLSELNKLNSFFEETYYYITLNYYFFKYFLFIFKVNTFFEKKLYLLFAINFISGNTFDNIRYYFQIKHHIRQKNIKSVVSIFEGHALERLIFKAAKSANKNIKTIAYNHSFITRKHNSVFLDLGINNKIDHIVFTNQISKNIFQNKIKFKYKPKLFCISKNISKSPNKSKTLSKSKNTCLIAPEGLDSETLKLFQFSIEYLKKYKDIYFIWRFHPIYYNREINFLEKKIPDFLDYKKNILISKKELNFDFKRSKYILYRGSSVVVDAIKNNLVPINLNFEKQIENNFLGDCSISSYLKFNSINQLYNIKKFHFDIKKIQKNKKKILNLYSNWNNNNKLKFYI